jgi:hypothetical protein
MNDKIISYIFAFLAGIFLALLGILIWETAKTSVQIENCLEYHEGIPIKGPNTIVCVKKDVVLKVYK